MNNRNKCNLLIWCGLVALTHTSAEEATCTLCPAGTASKATGSTNSRTCEVCGYNKWSDTGASECIDCHDNSQSETRQSTSADECLCNPGFYGSGQCTACSAGHFKSTIGSASCEVCGYNKWSDIGASECIDCHDNSQSVTTQSTSADECLCNPGFHGSGQCTACSAGRFKSTIGSASCEVCGYNGWSDIGASACIDCHDNSQSVTTQSTSADECTCNAGYGSL
jgi:hypothetical protein